MVLVLLDTTSRKLVEIVGNNDVFFSVVISAVLHTVFCPLLAYNFLSVMCFILSSLLCCGLEDLTSLRILFVCMIGTTCLQCPIFVHVLISLICVLSVAFAKAEHICMLAIRHVHWRLIA
jgi:hypothetical protein